MNRAIISTVALGTLFAAGAGSLAQPPSTSWRIVKPSNTGIPGEEVRFVRFAPDGKLWVGARWPFWEEGGLGIYDFEEQVWTDYVNWETPIPSEYVNDIEFGPSGVVWIATDGGLVKKDGETWTVYTTANAPLVHNQIMNIDLDADGHVWLNNSNVQTSDGAIFHFDGTTWQKFQVGQQLPWSPPWGGLSDVIVDHLGHVWVANQVLNGLAEYNGTTWTLRGASVDRFDALVEDLAGNIWMRGGVGGYNAFYKFNRATFTSYPIGTTPLTVAVDQDGAVYTGDWHGNVRKTTDAGQTWTYFLTGLNQVYNIEPDPASTDIWIGTPGAVGHFLGNGSWVRDYNTYNTGLPWYWLDRFNLDRAGNFWVATGEAGLSRFDGERWRNWGAHNAGSEPYPWAGNEPMGCFYLAANGVGWMGGNGIGRWDPETGQFTGFWNWQTNPGMGTNLFKAFAEDAAGTIFGSQQGPIFRFNGELWDLVSGPAATGGMLGDSQGNIWALAGNILWRWNGQSWQTFDTNPSLATLGGNNLAIASDDTLWIAAGQTLVRWDGLNTTLFTTSNSPMPYGLIMGIDVRVDGLIGLSVVDFNAYDSAAVVINGDPAIPEHWSTYGYGQSPLPHWQLSEVGFDREGDLWISALSEGAAVLHWCTPAGTLQMSRSAYPCEATVLLSLTDCGLNTDSNAVETIALTIASDSELAGEAVVLTEIAPAAAAFTGAMPLSATDAPGVLRVAHGDTVTVSYLDADDGQGGHGVLVTATAAVDCQPPTISGVTVTGIHSTAASVSFTTDELSYGGVRYGTDCQTLDGFVNLTAPHTTHVLNLTGLTPDTLYFFAALSTDLVSNASEDNHGGGCYAFRTMPAPHAAYSFALDTNPGWTTQGQWAWGQPTGGGSYNHDPTSGHTGTNVYGYNLSGDYTNNMPEYSLTTPPLDCSNLSEVSLRFWRWLGVQHPNFDHASLRVSTDGATWTTIWSNATQITDASWKLQQFDISAYADHQPAVYLRWNMGSTDASYTFCGWNIDDIEIWGVTPSITLLGDTNCDGAVNGLDVGPFVLALTDPAAYTAAHPDCNIASGDFDGSSSVDTPDIQLFVDLLLAS
jgi:hypothetical protein